MTREEWDAAGYHDFVPWSLATWKERIGLLCFWAIMWGVVMPACLIAILAVTGMMIEGIGRQNAEHDRCLKNATNGYEIRQCH